MHDPKKSELGNVSYSEALFRELFQHMSNCVAVYAAVDNGSDFVFLDFNRSAELLDNLSHEEVIGKRLTDCFPNAKDFGLVSVLQNVWKTGQPKHFPATYYQDNRIAGWRENYVYRLPTGEVVAIYDDVTKRKQAEFELRESHEKLDSLLNSMAEGAYGVDTNGICTFVNHSFMSILGYENPNDVIGKKIHDLIHHTRPDGSHYPSTECRMYAAYQRHQDIHVSDEVFWRKDGKAIPVEYWSKPIIRDGAIVGAIATFLDITERKKNEEIIHNLAFYDPLTRLPNRRLLNDRIGQALAASKRSGRYGAIMYIDLDNFKPLNDTHGHAAGDLLLAEAATRISACLREVDTIARMGGDEFVILVGDLNQDKTKAAELANAIAEKVRLSLAQEYFLRFKSDENADTIVHHTCTSSIGVTLFIGNEASQDEILSRSDTAMYRAKAAGRNQVRLYM